MPQPVVNSAAVDSHPSGPDAGGAAGRSRNPWIKSVRAAGSWQGSMTTEVGIRGFTFRSDEPVAVGGTNSAPTPMEFVAGAVNSCITVVIETVANELGVRLRAIETETAAHMDTRGFHGTADVSPHFHDYLLRVSIVANATEEVRRILTAQVERRCPALNLVRDAGVPLELVWQFRDEAALHDGAGASA